MEKNEWKRLITSLSTPFRVDLFFDVYPGADGEFVTTAEIILTTPGSRLCIDRYDEANIPDLPDTPEGDDLAKSREFGRVIDAFNEIFKEVCARWPVREKGGETRKNEPVKDSEFERFVADESEGVRCAARLRYYGDSYRALFGTPVRTAPRLLDGPSRGVLQPLNTRRENDRAQALVTDFLRTHEDRGFQ